MRRSITALIPQFLNQVLFLSMKFMLPTLLERTSLFLNSYIFGKKTKSSYS